MSLDIEFTEEEKAKVEWMSGKRWDELSDLAKFSFGFAARTYLSPEGIANTVLYGDIENWPK